MSLWYDSTWDWTPVSRTTGEHANHYANGPVYIYIYIYIYIYRERERERERYSIWNVNELKNVNIWIKRGLFTMFDIWGRCTIAVKILFKNHSPKMVVSSRLVQAFTITFSFKNFFASCRRLHRSIKASNGRTLWQWNDFSSFLENYSKPRLDIQHTHTHTHSLSLSLSLSLSFSIYIYKYIYATVFHLSM